MSDPVIKIRLKMTRDIVKDIDEAKRLIVLKLNYIESRNKELSECLDEIEERSK